MTKTYQELLRRLKKTLDNGEVVVLGGGNSSERNASIITSNRVFKSLKRMGVKSKFLDPDADGKNLLQKMKNAKIVFLGLHGGYGEDGTIQGWLDFNGIKHTGSNILTSAIGMNKIITKKIFIANKIPTPEYIERGNYDDTNRFIDKSESFLGYPLFVKIANEGSGNGVFFIKNRKEFELTLSSLEKNTDINMIYAERFIKGRELSVCVLEDEGKITVLPILEAKFDAEFFNNEIRIRPNGYVNEVPAKIEKLVENQIQDIATLSYKSVFASQYLRLDIRLEKDTNVPYVIEITTLPGLTEKSWLPAISETYGYSLNELIVRILLSAFEKKYVTQNKS